ncbi:hypothetical protein BKA62DRAFT_693377 [Auriculariales sp. MPI-PUGE-AT-0066]|nr:hypothetical protein BKA62DRAFT_693377 [Auriculariales sp. MPI-PUGE-AT-0066]
MPVKDIVGAFEARVTAEPLRRSSIGAPASSSRRLSLPPTTPSSGDASTGRANGSELPPARPARFMRHPLLVQSPPPLATPPPAPLTPPHRSRDDTPSRQISHITTRGSNDSRRLSFASAQREALVELSPIQSVSSSSVTAKQSARATASAIAARRASLPPSYVTSPTEPPISTAAPSFRSNSRPRYSAEVLSPVRSSQDTLRNPFRDSDLEPGSSTAELVPLQPIAATDDADDDPPSPTSTLIPQSFPDHRFPAKHSPVPAKTVFAKTAPSLYLPALDQHLAKLAPPAFADFPTVEPPSKQKSKGKRKSINSGEPAMFPPMATLAITGWTLDDLEHNAEIKQPWQDRNSIFGSLSNWVLGITGSSLASKHYSLQGIYDTIQVFALLLGAAVPEDSLSKGWRKVFLETIPNILALNFGSSFVQSLAWLCIFLVLSCLLLYYFNKATNQLQRRSIREGLQSIHDASGWSVIFATFGLTILYLPLSTIALHGVLWSSDFWVVPNPYLNGTTFPPSSLGPVEEFRDPLDFCYTTTMRKDQINWAPVIVGLSAVTFIFMSFWFPWRLHSAIKQTVPHVDPYSETGKKRTKTEMETEYLRLLDRDYSPFTFLYSDFRRQWAAYKSIYIWAKLSTLLTVAFLDPNNCVFRDSNRDTINIVRQAVLVVAMLGFFLVQCFLAPFNDPVSNASEWISRLNYFTTSGVGLLVALEVPGKDFLNGPVLYAYAPFLLSLNFSVVNFSWMHRVIKKLSRRIDFSIDVFSPHIDISSSSPHTRRRIWQETLSVLLLTSADTKIPKKQTMTFAIHREHPWPPYLLNFGGTPGERHVENLKILREVGWPKYTEAAAFHSGELGQRFHDLERAIVKHFMGPDAYWCNPAVPPVPGQMSYFGNAWWIPFPPTLVMHYDSGSFTTLTTLQELEDFVFQNGTRRMERKRNVRRSLRALDGKVVHWPYTHVEFVGSRNSLFGGPKYTAQKTQHFRHCVFEIKRQGDLMWNRVQLGSGFRLQLTFSESVHTDGTVIGLDEDFDLTPSLARFLSLNAPLVQSQLHVVDTAIATYRRHAWKEIRQKQSTLSYRFLTQVYNKPEEPAHVSDRALNTEQDLRVRSVILSHEDAFLAAFQRMELVTATPVRTWWYIFWDDFWRRNHRTVPPLETYHIDFNPCYPTSIAYRPLSRPTLESFLVQRGLLSTPPKKSDFVNSGLINKIYFKLNQIVFSASPYEVDHAALWWQTPELTVDEVDWALHQRGSTEGTGAGTDHDDASIRFRRAFTWESVWDDPVSDSRWSASSWRSKLSVWMGMRPRWTTWTTNGLALDVRLEKGRYVVMRPLWDKWDARAAEDDSKTTR